MEHLPSMMCVCLCMPSPVRLFVTVVACSPPGCSVHGTFQTRILEWVASSYCRELPDPGIKPVSLTSPASTGGFFTTAPPKSPTYLPLVK